MGRLAFCLSYNLVSRSVGHSHWLRDGANACLPIRLSHQSCRLSIRRYAHLALDRTLILVRSLGIPFPRLSTARALHEPSPFARTTHLRPYPSQHAGTRRPPQCRSLRVGPSGAHLGRLGLAHTLVTGRLSSALALRRKLGFLHLSRDIASVANT